MKRYRWLLLLCCLGCQSAPPPTVIQIKLVNQQKILAITGINTAILNDIDRDSIKNWQSLFEVYTMPADTDMKDYQPVQPGNYVLTDSTVAFRPDTPFIKQRVYFLRYYRHAGNNSLWDYLRGKTSKGQLHYTDLIFKQ